MTLWLLFARTGLTASTIYTFYAKSRHQAELKAQEILEFYGTEFDDLKEYPYGFTIMHAHIPGTLEEDLP